MVADRDASKDGDAANSDSQVAIDIWQRWPTRICLGILILLIGTATWYYQSLSYRPRPAPLDQPLYEHQALLLHDNRVLLFGGCNTCAMVRIYDPSQDRWKILSGGPSNRNGKAVLLVNGEVLFVGHGLAYNPATDHWRPVAPMLLNHGFEYSATTLLDGRVLVFGSVDVLPSQARQGGLVNRIDLSFAEIYDPRLDQWVQTALPLRGHSGHVAVLMKDGRVLIAGGNQPQDGRPTPNNHRRMSEIYDPNADRWVEVGDLIETRYTAAATLLPDGRVLIVGGLNRTRNAEIFDPANNQWRLSGRLQAQRTGHSITTLQDGRVIVMGGVLDQNTSYDSRLVDIYDTQKNNWSHGQPLEIARNRQAATVFPDGWVLLTGGSGPQTFREHLNPLMNTSYLSRATLAATIEWYRP